MSAPLWAVLAVLAAPVLVVAVIAALTPSTPVTTRRVAPFTAVGGLIAEAANPLLPAGLARATRQGVAGLAVAAAVVGLAVIGVVWSDRRHEAFQAEWAAYVTAENEGRQAPTASPRFAQVARSLAHNRRAEALREHPGVRPSAWRDAGAVEAGWLLLAVGAVVNLAAAVSNAAVGHWWVVGPATLGTVVSGWLAVTRAGEDRQRASQAAERASRGSTPPASGMCESCRLRPPTVRVVFPDGGVFAVCRGCAPVLPSPLYASPADSRAVAAFRRVGGGPR